jgi:hypothetical protein
LTTNEDVFSVLDTLLNINPVFTFAVELVAGNHGAGGDNGGSSNIATFNRRPVSGRMTMDVVVRLSNREGGCAEERNSGELHCEEAYS